MKKDQLFGFWWVELAKNYYEWSIWVGWHQKASSRLLAEFYCWVFGKSQEELDNKLIEVEKEMYSYLD